MEEYIHQPYWKVLLSDGQTVYSHALRRSWLELLAWLRDNTNVHILGLWFGFRDHVVEIHTGESDYFFTNSLLCEYGGSTQYFYIGGYCDEDVVICKKYRIPEVYLVEEESRSLDDPSVKKGLICRNKFIPQNIQTER